MPITTFQDAVDWLLDNGYSIRDYSSYLFVGNLKMSPEQVVDYARDAQAMQLLADWYDLLETMRELENAT